MPLFIPWADSRAGFYFSRSQGKGIHIFRFIVHIIHERSNYQCFGFTTSTDADFRPALPPGVSHKWDTVFWSKEGSRQPPTSFSLQELCWDIFSKNPSVTYG